MVRMYNFRASNIFVYKGNILNLNELNKNIPEMYLSKI